MPPGIKEQLMANQIKHLVVLMMENRSFDHMFGFLKSPSWKIDGLDGTETNPDSKGALVRATPDARYAGDFFPDPGHDFVSVNEQIFSNSTGTGTASMQGFVKAYEGKTGNVAKSHNIMKCFGAGRLPALSTLAQEYAVCDRWFASVPGPTLPNRAFVFGATSLGRVDMNPNYVTLKTVFELLDGHGVSSKIYYTDTSVGLAVGFVIQRAKKFLFFFDDFIKDCKKNQLPSYSFIEPRFNDFSDRGEFFPAADQHPDHNVFQGEKVIKAVYDAVTANKQTWESTLLVITYDEHGGLYDHVPPPATVNPGDKPPGSTLFNFERLGVRVPAVLVSPFIPRGTIIHDKIFDHTSVIATARKLFIPNSDQFFLTERDRQAKTFEDCLTLATPRQGKVSIPQPTSTPVAASTAAASSGPPRGGARRAPRGGAKRVASKSALKAELAMATTRPSNNPINDFQAAMVHHAFAFESKLPPQEQTDTLISSITTEQDASEYLAAIHEKIERGRNGGSAKSSSPRAGARKASKKSAQKAGQKAAQKAGRQTSRKASRKSGAKKR
jgi:phospholipase C